MKELLARSWPFMLPALLPILALLHVPLVGRRGRTIWSMLLGAIALFFVADIALFDHSGEHTLDVRTAFGSGEEGAPTLMSVGKVTAPVWQWHIVAALYFGVIGAYAWLARGRAAKAPQPILRATLVFAWALGARLALELTAAHEEIVWAVGATTATFAIAPFFGWYCGRRGRGFGGFVRELVIAVAVQKALLVAVGYVVTTGAHGTHLDTHTISEIVVPLRGRIVLSDAMDAWINTLLIPQMTFALVLTAVVGLVLGTLPWALARRAAPSA